MEYFKCLIVVILLSFYSLTCYAANANTPTCTYLGVTYHHGDAWVDKDTCDICQCGDYGLSCRQGLDGTGCKFNATVASPGDTVCLYGYQHAYLVGDTFKALDGCNQCTCYEDSMSCTNKACDPNGFETGTVGPLYGECLDNNLWYRLHTQWLATDGCNTCYCVTVGNYRGGHVCTTMKCTNLNVITG